MAPSSVFAKLKRALPRHDEGVGGTPLTDECFQHRSLELGAKLKQPRAPFPIRRDTFQAAVMKLVAEV